MVNNGFVVHVLDAAINLAPYGFLCNLGNQYKDGNF